MAQITLSLDLGTNVLNALERGWTISGRALDTPGLFKIARENADGERTVLYSYSLTSALRGAAVHDAFHA